jgi:hypothetical protein
VAEFSLTPFSDQCVILTDLWLNYRSDEGFTDFIEYNDIGLPLAYAVTKGLAEVNSVGESLIEETFSLLLEGLGLDDTGFDSLDEVLDANTFLEDGE